METKALEKLTQVEHAQVIHDRKVSSLKRGLLLNFGTERLEYQSFRSFGRFVHTKSLPEVTP